LNYDASTQPQSAWRLGCVSVALFGTALLALFLGVVGAIMRVVPGLGSFFALVTSCALMVAGLIFGIVGVMPNRTERVLAVQGVMLNGAFLLFKAAIVLWALVMWSL
jgi:hypothetical protein